MTILYTVCLFARHPAEYPDDPPFNVWVRRDDESGFESMGSLDRDFVDRDEARAYADLLLSDLTRMLGEDAVEPNVDSY